MGASVTVNSQTVVHKDSDGSVVTSPDICITPVGNAALPIPYVNVANSADTAQGSSTVSMDGNPVMIKTSLFSTSSGDEAGMIGGISSGVTQGKARFVTTSNDVLVEGQPIARRNDLMVSNLSISGNTPPSALQQPNADAEPRDADGYVLAIALMFKHPHVVTGGVVRPLLSLSYTVSGPGAILDKEIHPYPGIQRKVRAPGSYSFKINDFEVQERQITEEVRRGR